MSRVSLAAPVAGWLMSVRDVPDPVFSEEMLGVGFAIDPTEGTLVAPCAAQVLLVAPTRHSVTLRTEDGAELLMHVGLETVALQGRGFEAHVADGDHVAAGDLLISFDLDLVGLEAKSLLTPVVLTNSGEFQLALEPLDRLVERGQPIGSLEGKSKSAPPPALVEGEVHTLEAEVGFAHGLHARPAARIADCAKRYSSDITISVNGKSANARSPVAIMALNAKRGDRVGLTATGQGERRALEALAALISGRDEPERSAPIGAAPPRAVASNEIAGVCALPGVALGTAVHWRREVRDTPEVGRGADDRP